MHLNKLRPAQTAEPIKQFNILYQTLNVGVFLCTSKPIVFPLVKKTIVLVKNLLVNWSKTGFGGRCRGTSSMNWKELTCCSKSMHVRKIVPISQSYANTGLSDTFDKCMRKVIFVFIVFVRFDRFTRCRPLSLYESERRTLQVCFTSRLLATPVLQRRVFTYVPCREPPACRQWKCCNGYKC